MSSYTHARTHTHSLSLIHSHKHTHTNKQHRISVEEEGGIEEYSAKYVWRQVEDAT